MWMHNPRRYDLFHQDRPYQEPNFLQNKLDLNPITLVTKQFESLLVYEPQYSVQILSCYSHCYFDLFAFYLLKL